MNIAVGVAPGPSAVLHSPLGPILPGSTIAAYRTFAP